LVVVKTVSVALIDIKYFEKIMQEANFAKRGFAKGPIGFQEYVLSSVTLLQELIDELLACESILHVRMFTFRRSIFVASVRSS